MMERRNVLGEPSGRERADYHPSNSTTNADARLSEAQQYPSSDTIHLRLSNVRRFNRSSMARSLSNSSHSHSHNTSVLVRGPQFMASMTMTDATMAPLPASQADKTRPNHAFLMMPDLYRRSPGTSRSISSASTSNVSLATNTAPRQYPTNKAVPSNGIRELDMSMRSLLKLSCQKSFEKNRENKNELDGNLAFPVKLYYILSNPKYQDCVAWLLHGRAWRVINPKTFEKKVMTKFFRTTKYASFMRQVSRGVKRNIDYGTSKSLLLKLNVSLNRQ
jgi:hypothetical protein